ncbi:hypothetical protein [Mycobacterium sp.]|uniref:hypothetical protein n=1 Tax=Mycobacterium sp. TaxID=1785 RepID=UPI003F981CBB
MQAADGVAEDGEGESLFGIVDDAAPARRGRAPGSRPRAGQVSTITGWPTVRAGVTVTR